MNTDNEIPRPPLGRPKSADPLVHFPFRIRASIAEKAARLGRERIEAMIRRAKDPEEKSPG